MDPRPGIASRRAQIAHRFQFRVKRSISKSFHNAAQPNDPGIDPFQDPSNETTAAVNPGSKRGKLNTSIHSNEIVIDAHLNEIPIDRTGSPAVTINANDKTSVISRIGRLVSRRLDSITQKVEVNVPRRSSLVRIVSPPHAADQEQNLVYNIQSKKFSATQHVNLKAKYSKFGYSGEQSVGRANCASQS